MAQKLKRREFLSKGSRAGVACCAMLMGAHPLLSGNGLSLNAAEPIDPKNLNYCGYKCPADCIFLQASLKNDPEMKKKAYEQWKIKEKYNMDFEAENIFCFGCKNPDKPQGVILTNCTVRQCAVSKGFDCCVECNELTGCKKELWSLFPDFKQQVIQMQKQYYAEQGLIAQ
jgi:hypothetical protein